MLTTDGEEEGVSMTVDEALAQCGICDGFYDPTREEHCPRCGSAVVVERKGSS